jgi:hypothetical protein
MNGLLKNHTRRLLIFMSFIVLSTIGINLFHTESASARWIDDVPKDYVVYGKSNTWLYWNSRYSTWAFINSTPKIKLNGSECSTKDKVKDFDSSETFNNCKGLVFSANDNAAWFNEAQLAYQIADFDSAETAAVEGGRITQAGDSSSADIVIASDGKSAWSKNGDGDKDGKGDGGCSGANPNTSNSCSILVMFNYGYGDAFKISLNNKWNTNGSASSGHEFWYDYPATKQYLTFTFDPNGGSVDDNQVQSDDGTIGDEATLWSHKSDGKVLREYVKGSTANEYPTPTKADNNFLGWYSAAVGGSLICSSPVSPTGCSRTMNTDLTLYAHWAPIPPPNVLTCSVVFTLSSLLVNNASTLNLSGSGTVSPVTRISGSITGPSTNQPFTVNAASGTASFTPPASGTYTASATAYDSAGKASPPCVTTIQAGYRPYFEISGGDLIAGTQSDVSPNFAKILAWNGGSGDYRGANSSLALIATGTIDGAMSGKQSSNSVLNRLSFANTAGTGSYGGSFNPNTLPALEYTPPTTTKLLGAGSYNVATLAGSYKANGNITLFGQLTGGSKVTIDASAYDVLIGGNILYSYNSVVSIPHLSVYAQNIYVIDKSISEMHGTFHATNKFSTCGNIQPSDLSNPVVYNACNGQLKVYGAVSAGQLLLVRTHGSWNDNVKGPAEQFIQGPEAWLNGDATDNFDHYVSLPPIL